MDDKKLLKELKAIKNLLVLQLLNSKMPSKSLAKMIKMDAGDFSKAYPISKLLPKQKSDKNAKRSKK